MADTGCQSCLAGIEILDRLGITLQELLPVTLKMHAVNNNGIKILGAAILRFIGEDQNKNQVETRQITYITDCSDKIFLSREACTSLRMITPNFPMVGETTLNSANSASISGDQASIPPDCTCPRSELPPPMPKELPCPPTTAKRASLQQFPLKHYHSSTFNTCEHQPYP